MDKTLKDLLEEYRVDRDFSKEFKEGYRVPIEKDINDCLKVYPNFRYGGSLAKGTANTNSCDIDLLCYYDSDCQLGLKEIYNMIADALINKGYFVHKKNSAICVDGKCGEDAWDTTIDVVPGKYTSNEDNKDVYLWCNRTGNKLKSNPEIQINKVKESKSKDVIRLIKLYRTNHNFTFKSFFLEIFAIDIVEPLFEENDTLYDKLVKFCSCFNEIGKRRVEDPANSNNNIMDIHDENEFSTIRRFIKKLYEVLLTNDESAVVDYIIGKDVNIGELYKANAKSHAPQLRLDIPTSTIRLTSNNQCINNGGYVEKNVKIDFYIKVPNHIRINKVQLIVSNAGYEAAKNDDYRGDVFDVKCKNNMYKQSEHTSYNGNHYVQAIVSPMSGGKLYSSPLIVKVREHSLMPL